jgi:hypothetical protein
MAEPEAALPVSGKRPETMNASQNIANSIASALTLFRFPAMRGRNADWAAGAQVNSMEPPPSGNGITRSRVLH